MDQSIFSNVLRNLFTTPARHCLRRRTTSYLERISLQQKRCYAIRRPDVGQESSWQQRLDAFPKDMSKSLREYPRVTSAELRHRTQRPRRVKMLTREFIEDSLYNPNYGYFSKHATIFNSKEPFDFNDMTDEAAFNRMVDQSYVEFEDALDQVAFDETRQLWHTPTELFRPHYGEAIARYLVTNYKMTLYPYHDLIVYEIGAGNGTLMRNILDHIRETDEEVYHRTKFRVVEISSALAEIQLANLQRSPYAQDHVRHVEIVNRSIFDWNEYDPNTEQPLQGSILIDENGDFFEFYEPSLEPVLSRYLQIRNVAARSAFKTPVSGSRFLRKFRHSLPLAPNLTLAEYVPTRLMQFFDVLNNYFPAHRLILSDFTTLPTAVRGFSAPVVQTRYQRRNVTVTTPFVHQGYFDIFFPTDFDLMEDIYRAITGKLTRVSSHRNFLQHWAYVDNTQTKNGENPMLSWYKNAAVMTTV